ncbi:MAG: multicopper oxidase domain-containing protein, partial [Nitrospiraceae bacterium]|nr:multicopper oxidase domain-containing protein [Nitrospiraceae bacterium]
MLSRIFRSPSVPMAFISAVFLVLVLIPPPLFAATREFKLTIEEVTIRVAPDLTFNTFAFDGQVPGPLIHVREGDNVIVHVTNNTSLPHTIHWHGINQTH